MTLMTLLEIIWKYISLEKMLMKVLGIQCMKLQILSPDPIPLSVHPRNFSQ